MQTKSNYKLKICLPKIDSSPIMYGAVMLCISEALPIFSVLPGLIRYVYYIATFFLITIGMANDSRMFMDYSGTLFVTLLLNLYAYIHIYTDWPISNFFIQIIRSWLFIMLGVYFAKKGTQLEKNIIAKLILYISIITSITSFFVSMFYPETVRVLGNLNLTDDENRFFLIRNTATWGMLYGIVFLIPSLSKLYQNKKNKKWLFVIAVLMLCVIRSEVTIAILFGIVFVVFAFVKVPPLKKQILIALLIGILSAYGNKIIIGMLHFVIYNILGRSSSFEMLRHRLFELYDSLMRGYAVGDAGARFDLYHMSWNTFIHNPIFGYNAGSGSLNNTYVGRHSQILDLMAAVGLVGIIPLMVIFIDKERKVARGLDNESRNYQIVTFIFFVIFMFLNPVIKCPTTFMAVFLFPIVSEALIDQ